MASSRSRLAIFLLAVLQFTLFLNHRDITTAHEGRVAATASEMLDRRDWLIPHLNDQPRLQKPPLAYWLTAAAWSVGNSREVWLARLPAALCGAIATLLIMDLARRILGNRAAPIAGLVWLSTWFIVDEYRKSMADPYLAFFVLLTLWAWIAAHPPTPRQSAAPPRTVRAGPLILLAYLALALGTLAKGPLILLHVAVALITYHLVTHRKIQHLRAHIIGVMLFILLSTAWPLFAARTVPGTWTLWLRELTASSATSGSKSSPIYHYFAALPLTAAPWTVFAIIGILMPLLARRRREKRALWPLVWLAATVILFSFVPMKKNAYLLPAMPAQTLLITAAIASSIRIPRATKHAKTERLLFIAHAAAAIVALGVMIYLVMSIERFEIEPPAPLMAAGAITLFLLLAWKQLFPQMRTLRTVTLISLLFALAVHAADAWLIPDRDNQRSDAPLALTAILSAGDNPIVIIGPGLREDVLFYIGRPLKVFASIDQLPADFRGVALVTADQTPPTRRADRGDEITASQNRSDADTIRVYRFPKGPPPPPDDRP